MNFERFQYLADAIRRHWPVEQLGDRVMDPHSGMTVADLHGLIEAATPIQGEAPAAPSLTLDAVAKFLHAMPYDDRTTLHGMLEALHTASHEADETSGATIGEADGQAEAGTTDDGAGIHAPPAMGAASQAPAEGETQPPASVPEGASTDTPPAAVIAGEGEGQAAVGSDANVGGVGLVATDPDAEALKQAIESGGVPASVLKSLEHPEDDAAQEGGQHSAG